MQERGILLHCGSCLEEQHPTQAHGFEAAGTRQRAPSTSSPAWVAGSEHGWQGGWKVGIGMKDCQLAASLRQETGSDRF